MDGFIYVKLRNIEALQKNFGILERCDGVIKDEISKVYLNLKTFNLISLRWEILF